MLEFLFNPGNPYVWILIIGILSGAVAVIFRPFASYIQFVYPNAKYEAIGNPYIHQGILDKLVESETIDQFIDQVNSNKDYHIEATQSSDIQNQLNTHLQNYVLAMKKEQGKKMQRFFSIYEEYQDSKHLKTLFRDLFQKKPIDYDTYLNQVQSPSIKHLITQLSTATPETIPTILTMYGFDSSLLSLYDNQEILPLQIDSALDSYYLHKMKSLKLPYNCHQAIFEYLSRLTDINTISHLIRAKHMRYHEKLCQHLYIGEGYEIPQWKFQELCTAETVQDIIESLNGTSYYPSLKQTTEKQEIDHSVQPLITSLQKHQLSIVKQLSQQYYTSIGPTLRFLISKETEIRNLKIISKGLIEHLTKTDITPLLITEVSS